MAESQPARQTFVAALALAFGAAVMIVPTPVAATLDCSEVLCCDAGTVVCEVGADCVVAPETYELQASVVRHADDSVSAFATGVPSDDNEQPLNQQRQVLTACTEVDFIAHAPYTGTQHVWDCGNPNRDQVCAGVIGFEVWLIDVYEGPTTIGLFCGPNSCSTGTISNPTGQIILYQQATFGVPIPSDTTVRADSLSAGRYYEDANDDGQWSDEDPLAEDVWGYHRVFWSLGPNPT